MSARTITVTTPSGDVPLTVTESGAGGRPVLLLHGGAGPDSVTGFGEALAGRFPFRVLSPVYPGFSGTARPGWLDSMGTLAGVLGGLEPQPVQEHQGFFRRHRGDLPHAR